VPRFVILEHDHPALHWDLMLETGAVLRTWRLEAPPEPDTAVRAEPLTDHRLLYLDYEGPISGGRGAVRRWDAGSYHGLAERDGTTEFHLEGTKVRGRCSLEPQAGGEWRLRLTLEASPSGR
jgi:DNA polymerase ligase (LigD)-like protein